MRLWLTLVWYLSRFVELTACAWNNGVHYANEEYREKMYRASAIAGENRRA